MPTPAKPDSSYASNRLNRRNNRNGGPPLTQVMGKPIQRRGHQGEKSEPKTNIRPEPATDDEPESSSNEECETSDDELSAELGTKRRVREPGMTLHERLVANGVAASPEAGRITRSSRRRESGGLGPQMGQKRGNSSSGTNVDEEMLWRSSQNKRTKTYHSRMNRNGSSPNVQSSQPQAGTRTMDSTPVNSQEEKEEGFKFPMEVDLGSPRTPSGAQKNNDVKPTAVCSSLLATSSADDRWFFDDDGSGLSTPLSSASSSFMLELSQVDEAFAAESAAQQSVCPVCKKPVDPECLQAFLSQPRQRVRDQLQFCESHQQIFAQQQWREKGYPLIDWETFNERIQGHLAELEPLLVPDSPSFYRNVLVSALKSGKAKNFRLSLAGDGLETISCGYYGTRGASEMLQALTRHFSRKIHRLASSDQVANKAGVVGYAQFVLVPELTMRLVKEDMNVCDETARQIMRESIDIGEKINPALNDVVPVPEEAEGDTN